LTASTKAGGGASAAAPATKVLPITGPLYVGATPLINRGQRRPQGR
jgi:hypothetical protein